MRGSISGKDLSYTNFFLSGAHPRPRGAQRSSTMGAMEQGGQGRFPERIHIIGSTHPLLTDFQATL